MDTKLGEGGGKEGEGQNWHVYINPFLFCPLVWKGKRGSEVRLYFLWMQGILRGQMVCIEGVQCDKFQSASILCIPYLYVYM